MTDSFLLAEGGGDGWIQIIVFVLIGLAAAIQWIVKWIASRGREKVEGEKPTPSLGDEVSREIRKYLGVESLAYLEPEAMLSCTVHPSKDYCTACFTGDYPVPVRMPRGKMDLEEDGMSAAPAHRGRSKRG